MLWSMWSRGTPISCLLAVPPDTKTLVTNVWIFYELAMSLWMLKYPNVCLFELVEDLPVVSHTKELLCILYFYVKNNILITWRRSLLQTLKSWNNWLFQSFRFTCLLVDIYYSEISKKLWKKYGVLGPNFFLLFNPAGFLKDHVFFMFTFLR